MQEADIQGLFFDGQTSTKHQAALFYRDDGQVGITASDRSPVPVESLRISSRIGNTPRYIEFPDGSQFETTDNDAVDRLCQRLGYRDRQGFIHALESNKRYVFATLLIVIAAVWGFVQYGVPAMSREIALLMPDTVSETMGEGVLDFLDEQFMEPSALSEPRQAELRALFNRFADQVDDGMPLRVEFRDGGPMAANAFALPDGTIVFTDQLIELASDDREIASVMLHEIGHVYYRHSLRSAIQQFSLAMLVMLVTGDVSASSSVITALPVVLVQSGYSRNMEWEADGFALHYMQQLDIPPEYFARMMEKLEARYSDVYADCVDGNNQVVECMDRAVASLEQNRGGDIVESYLSTHPLSRERIERFRQFP